MTAWLLLGALLTGLYVVLVASYEVADFIFGAALASTLLAFSHGLRLRAGAPGFFDMVRRIAAVPGLVFALIRDIVSGTWVVIGVVLGWKDPQGGIVAVPVEERSDVGIAMAALLTTLSPGTVFVNLDAKHGLLYFHVIGVSSPGAFRHRMMRFYERYQRRVFP